MKTEEPAAEDARPAWMGLLARAPEPSLARLWAATGLAPAFEWLRRPECGAVMVRGRIGGTGMPFNLGELTVTRAAVRLTDGKIGHAYIPGRDKRKAEIAALCDALMQTPATAPRIEAEVLAPLRRIAADAARTTAARAAATKVDFFTMVRGED